jgi:hypothetical protein
MDNPYTGNQWMFEEYGIAVEGSRRRNGDVDRARLVRSLVAQHDWTESAAEHLLALATGCGTFMLRNALALAQALEIEDGESGF